MGIKNKDGETPGQILELGTPWDSAEEEEDEASGDANGDRSCRGRLEGRVAGGHRGRFEGKDAISIHSRPSSPLASCAPFSRAAHHLLTAFPKDHPHLPSQTDDASMRPRSESFSAWSDA